MDWLFATYAIHGIALAGWEWAGLGVLSLGAVRAVFGGGRRHRSLPPGTGAPQMSAPPPRPLPPPKRAAQVLPEMSALAANRLPPSVQMKIGQIRRKVEAILQYSEQFPVGSEDLYLVEHTATDYLPQTLEAYLRLPPASHNQPVEPGGKTAWEELWSQLNLLEAKLEEVAADLKRQNADQLLANGKFLEARFRPRSADLDPAPGTDKP